MKVKVVKNKVAPPFKIANFDIMFNKGINYTGELIDLGVHYDIVNKSGAWFSYGKTRLGQGRDNSCQFLEENADIMREIEQKLQLVLFPQKEQVPENTETSTLPEESVPSDADPAE